MPHGRPRSVRALLADRRGVTAVEYALIGAFIFLVIVVAATRLGTALLAPFGIVSAALP